jgi:hypothetical protein
MSVSEDSVSRSKVETGISETKIARLVTRETLHHARQPTAQGKNPLWIEIIVDYRMPSMN